MTARRATKNSVLVLQTNHVEICEIQKISSLLIRREIVLRKSQPHTRRIRVSRLGIVDRQGE